MCVSERRVGVCPPELAGCIRLYFERQICMCECAYFYFLELKECVQSVLCF